MSSLPIRRDPRYLSTLALQISDVGYGGRGVGRFEGVVVFVPRVLPGEVVRVGVVRKKKRYWEAEPIEVVKRSQERVEPRCSLFGRCPGCSYQHASYREEMRIKELQLRGFFGRQLRAEAAEYLHSVDSPEEYGYRNRLTFHVSVTKDAVLGYVGEDNRSILDVSDCPLGHEAINRALREKRADRDWMGSLGNGDEILFRYTQPDGVHIVNRNRKINQRGNTTAEPVWITERTDIGAIRVLRDGFFQVNLEIANALLAGVSELIERICPQTVVDFYSGVGLFALAARKSGVERVFGVDSEREAIEAARYNAAALGLEPIAFFAGSAGRFAQQLPRVDASSAVWIADPPRRGLEGAVIASALEKKPAHILYISCAPDTLTRDVSAFIRGGYRVQSIQLFDMFPKTAHFESITHLVL